MNQTNSSRPWWQELYDDLLAEFLLVREEDRIQEEISFLIEILRLRAGMRILDQCCGIGSLSLPLARHGLLVTGVDQAEDYIARARREANAQGLAIDFHAADAMEFVPEHPVDAVLNWYTSWGYHADDGQNIRMLRRAFEALAPGGRFALDTMNLTGVLRSFQRDVVLRRLVAGSEIVLHRKSSFDLARGLMIKHWEYFLPDGHRISRESAVRLYMPHEVVRMLRSCGFTEIELVGNLAGEALHIDSSRLIALAQRPKP